MHQIDSVNALVRAHYLPAFSRLGPYDRSSIERAAWGRPSERRLFEYWAHEASLLPLDLHPLLRWRMARADRGTYGWAAVRRYATERRPAAEAILARIRDDGPLAASDFSEGRSGAGWWVWGETKQALEWLFWAGHVTTHTRRRNFERVYDLTARAIPPAIRALPTPDEDEAHRALIERANRAMGVATDGDLRDYFRLGVAETRLAIGQLVESGILIPVQVVGWTKPAYLHRAARRPRRIEGAALLAPFDPLIWHRDRAERLFGFRYRIEIYVPADRRVHGYYVLPFLLDEALVARVDLKADRQNSCLIARGIHLEPNAPADTLDQLRIELRQMATWLGLERVKGIEPSS